MNFKSLLSNKWFLAATFFLIYTWLINWKFTIVLMCSIGFHESGHLWAANKKGLSTGGFVFIPFLGGLAAITENYKTFAQQAYIAIMGPIWGLTLATITMLLGISLSNSFLTITATWMGIFNLFNLIPVTFLDGGQILKTIVLSLSKIYGFTIINYLTIVTAGIFFYYIHSPLIIFATIISVLQNIVEAKQYLKSKSSLPRDLTNNQMIKTIISYVSTIILLVIIICIGFTYTHIFTGHYSFIVK